LSPGSALAGVARNTPAASAAAAAAAVLFSTESPYVLAYRPCSMKSTIAAATSRCTVSLRMSCAREILELQPVDLFSVSAHRADRRDRIVDAVHSERRYRQVGEVAAEPIPRLVEFARQRLAVASTKAKGRSPVNPDRKDLLRANRDPSRMKCRVRHFGDGKQRGTGDDARA